MGWENETGRMDYKFFWGGEGDTPLMSAPLFDRNKWGVPSEKKARPPETRLFALCDLARTSQGATNHKQGCSLRLAMFTCGACADEIVLQEGIRHPGHACKSPFRATTAMCSCWSPS